MSGEAGVNRRGLWIDDRETGTRFRLGEIGMDMAYHLTEIGNTRAARQVMSKPHAGFIFSKSF